MTKLLCSLFCLLLFVSSPSAQASIVVKDYEPNIVLNDTDPTDSSGGDWEFVLNLDEDLLGLDDFRLSNRETTVMGVASFENRIETLNVDAFISTTSLNLGDVVDDQTVFTRDPQVITNLSGDSYWGLRLDTETGSQYGFIRSISPDNGVQSEFVIDFAKFNTNVGESILIAAVPEPSTAFLATIALFSCSFRRRRKKLQI